MDEYYIYDPISHEVCGYTRSGADLIEIANMDGHVSRWLGVTFETKSGELRIIGPDGEPFVTHEELGERKDQTIREKDQTIQQKDQALQQKDEALQQKEQAIRQKDQIVRAALLSLGTNLLGPPDTDASETIAGMDGSGLFELIGRIGASSSWKELLGEQPG